MDERSAICHRCRVGRVRVYGMQCPPCQEITDREYWAERARRGGRLLYLEGVDLERVAAGLREDDVSPVSANGGQAACRECGGPFHPSNTGWSKVMCGRCFGLRRRQQQPTRQAVVRQAAPAPARPTERVTATVVQQRAVKSPQELADALTERVLSVVDAFNLDFNLGNCLRLILERATDRPEHEKEDLVWARKYLDRAIARLL